LAQISPQFCPNIVNFNNKFFARRFFAAAFPAPTTPIINYQSIKLPLAIVLPYTVMFVIVILAAVIISAQVLSCELMLTRVHRTACFGKIRLVLKRFSRFIEKWKEQIHTFQSFHFGCQ